MRNKQLVVNSLYYTIGEVLPRIIGFFLLPVLTRCLTPAEYGINSYTNTVMLFSFALSSLSLNTYLLRNYYKEDSEEDKRSLTGNVFVWMLLANTLLTGLEYLLFPPALRALSIGIPFHPFFELAICNNFLEGLSIVPLILFRVWKDARTFVLINATKTLFQFVLTYILLTKAQQGLTGVYLARLWINIPYTILFLGIVYRHARIRLNTAGLRTALRFSLPLLPGALSYLFISSFDRLVLEKNIGLGSLGLYSSAATLSLALNIIVQGLYRSFEQKIFEKHGSPEYANVQDNLYKYFILCLFTGGFMLSLYSKDIFVLFTTQQFMEAYRLVPLLAIPVILSGLSTLLGTFLIADHRQHLITRATGLSVLLTIAGNLALIPVIGVYGAILSSTLSYGAICLFYLRHAGLKHHYGFHCLGLLALSLSASLGLSAFDMPVFLSLLVKTIAVVLFFGLCAALLRIRLTRPAV